MRLHVHYCRDSQPVDMLVTTNHMVETDKLQSEVSMRKRMWTRLFHVCVLPVLDIKLKETAGAKGPSSEGERQTGKPLNRHNSDKNRLTLNCCFVFIDLPAES